MDLKPGDKFGDRYQCISKLGEGGMGEVWKARDTRLDRDVALKVSKAEFTARFDREARAIAAFNHPNICQIYDVGPNYIVMELIDGAPLSGPLPVEKAVAYAGLILDALDAAHHKGFTHRDLKPANVLVTKQGLKLLDFGLAKQGAVGLGPDDVTGAALTVKGQISGTLQYMSPEQLQGKEADARSDIFSFGVVLYELLSGRQAFSGNSAIEIMAAIMRDEPAPLDAPPELGRIVARCLAKKPEDRYASATEVHRELQALERTAGARFRVPRPLAISAVLILVIALGAIGGRWYTRASRARWAKTVALPEAARLMEHDRFLAAVNLMRQAEAYVPDARELISLKEHLAPASIGTTPPGADIYIIDYADPRAGDLRQWEHLSRSPLKTVPLPRESGYLRLRAVKEGYETDERAISGLGGGTFRILLHKRGENPPGMVWIPAFRPAGMNLNMRFKLRAAQIPAAWLDKYEVTNRQFKEFVDAGGYQKREYWRHPFLKNGKQLGWEQATAEFRDATGRPGPSTWEAGSYPDGKADFPVAGVSWYEAAAYAEFAGKSLPDVYHWYLASGMYDVLSLVPLSNFGGKGTMRVGASLGLGPYGTYDMAGNVKEWVLNPSGEKRYSWAAAGTRRITSSRSWTRSRHLSGERRSDFAVRAMFHLFPRT